MQHTDRLVRLMPPCSRSKAPPSSPPSPPISPCFRGELCPVPSTLGVCRPAAAAPEHSFQAQLPSPCNPGPFRGMALVTECARVRCTTNTAAAGPGSAVAASGITVMIGAHKRPALLASQPASLCCAPENTKCWTPSCRLTARAGRTFHELAPQPVVVV